jgi:hypothetical protein
VSRKSSVLSTLLSTLSLVVAGVILVALITQILEQVARGTFLPENYFWFFSIQTSLANIVVLGVSGILSLARHPVSRGLVVARGALVTFSSMTSVVYHALLLDLVEGPSVRDPLTQWPLDVVHVWVPIYLVVDWVFDNKRPALRWWFVLVGFAYPVVWFIASLIRGGLTGWYPYPFMNPNTGEGWVAVWITAGLIGLAALASLSVVLVINRVQHRAMGNPLT